MDNTIRGIALIHPHKVQYSITLGLIYYVNVLNICCIHFILLQTIQSLYWISLNLHVTQDLISAYIAEYSFPNLKINTVVYKPGN